MAEMKAYAAEDRAYAALQVAAAAKLLASVAIGDIAAFVRVASSLLEAAIAAREKANVASKAARDARAADKLRTMSEEKWVATLQQISADPNDVLAPHLLEDAKRTCYSASCAAEEACTRAMEAAEQAVMAATDVSAVIETFAEIVEAATDDCDFYDGDELNQICSASAEVDTCRETVELAVAQAEESVDEAQYAHPEATLQIVTLVETAGKATLAAADTAVVAIRKRYWGRSAV